MMAITMLVPSTTPDTPPTFVTRVLSADKENIATALQRARRLAESSGLFSRPEAQQEKVLISVTRQLPEVIENGHTNTMGRADILWKGNLVTATAWLDRQTELEQPTN